MSFTSIKQLFVVAFLGLALTACGSDPVVNDANASNANGQAINPEGGQAAGSDAAAGSTVQAGNGEAGNSVDGNNLSAGGVISATEEQKKLFELLQGKVVNFDFDRSEVKPQFREIIKLNADYLALNKSATVTLKGHCDERGSEEYNLALGERRANAVKNALVAEGITPSRITVISFGEEKPVDAGHTEAAWEKNRRTEFSY